MRRFIWFAVSCLGLPYLTWAQAAQTTASFGYLYQHAGGEGGSRRSLVAQMILCDLSGNIPGSDARVGGETCVSGDWTNAVDCTGALTATMTVNEFGGGTGNVILWNVIPAFGTATTPPLGGDRQLATRSNLALPGVEDPSGTPTAADPDPLAVNLNGATTVDGTTTRALAVTDRSFNYLVAEVNDCTGECDMRVVLQCDW